LNSINLKSNYLALLCSISIKPVFFVCCLLFTGNVIAAMADDLRDKYEEIEEALFENNYSIPLYLESNTSKAVMHGDAFGILYHPFKTVSNSLKSLISWCGIMTQHINIKACTYQFEDTKCKLSLYSGRKYYEKADDVYQLNYNFTVNVLTDDYFNASLKAKEGPIDTKDYHIFIEAIPLTDSSTFIHFRYEYKFGIWTRIGMSTYLSTLGRNKVGFSVTGYDKDNMPIYIKGVRGIIERNATRYYFAIQSYIESLATPLGKRFNTRISYWFDLTEQHYKQLHEMNKTDYLNYKTMEHHDQMRLQNIINSKDTTFNHSHLVNSECKDIM